MVAEAEATALATGEAADPVPLGMIESAYGGTTIEQWVPIPDQLKCSNISCHANKSLPVSASTIERCTHDAQEGNGGLWRGMTAPFVNMTLTGFLWCVHVAERKSGSGTTKTPGLVVFLESAVDHDSRWCTTRTHSLHGGRACGEATEQNRIAAPLHQTLNGWPGNLATLWFNPFVQVPGGEQPVRDGGQRGGRCRLGLRVPAAAPDGELARRLERGARHDLAQRPLRHRHPGQ